MVRDMKIILDSTDHTPGSIVQGRVMIGVDKPYKCHSIVVELWGGATVRWEDSDDSFDISDPYISSQDTVWKVDNSPTGALPVGEHYFPFSFQLPQNTVPSFK